MTASDKRESESQSEEFEWNVDNEVHLFMAMSDSKPAGVNKYFHMMDIADKFSALVGREISSSVIWKHLDTLYDMKMCDDIEGIPFPNETKEFSLPESEFGQLLKTKLKNASIPTVADESDGDRAASPKQQVTPRSTSRGASSKDTPVPKGSKKDQNEKHKRESESSSGRPATPAIESPAPAKTSEKETSKQDIRRDSKDSNASSKESSSSKGPSNASKTPAKESKGTKTKRDSFTDKTDESSKGSDDTPSSKRGSKRPLRGSLKPEEQPTPPGRRRRI